MFKRKINFNIQNRKDNSKPILVLGAKSIGKTTAVKNSFLNNIMPAYIRLNDVNMFEPAKKDPVGFLENLSAPFVLDEVWRVPELLPELKLQTLNSSNLHPIILVSSVDLEKISGGCFDEFEVFRMRGLSQGEIEDKPETFVDKIFDVNFEPSSSAAPVEDRRSLFERMLRGGYPEILETANKSVQRKRVDSYLNGVLYQDLRDITKSENPRVFAKLLSEIAKRTGSQLNYAELSRLLGLSPTTLQRYFNLLEATFLIEKIPAWKNDSVARLVKSPIILIGDTGLFGHLLELSNDKILSDSLLLNRLTVNFVILELYKQIGWSSLHPNLFHFQTSTGHQVDALLENSAGKIVGIQIKSTASVFEKDFSGLRVLARTAGKNFLRGIVLYGGAEVKFFNEKFLAIPINHLWNC